jgi:hypothetical protein
LLDKVNIGDRLYHKYLDFIEVTQVCDIYIKADTGDRGVLVFKFYDFGKVIYFEKEHAGSTYNTYYDYLNFYEKEIEIKKDAQAKIEQECERKRLRQIELGNQLALAKHNELDNKIQSDIRKVSTENINFLKNNLKPSNKSDYKIVDFEICKILNLFIEDTKKIIMRSLDSSEVKRIFDNHYNGNFSYSDKDEQTLYLLRYFYAYCYEYRCIFREIYKDFNSINLLSIGCGAGIDALSLMFSAKGILKKQYSYLGIDIVEWHNIKNILKLGDNLQFKKIVIDINSKEILENRNVFFFPKSLSDIDYRDMENIYDCFNNFEFSIDIICVAVSYVYNGVEKGAPWVQSERYNKMVELFKRKGYIDIKKSSFCNKKENKILIWNKEDCEFKKPENLLNFFNYEMENLCNKYKSTGVHCKNCGGDDEFSESGIKRGKLPKLNDYPTYYEITILRKEK